MSLTALYYIQGWGGEKKGRRRGEEGEREGKQTKWFSHFTQFTNKNYICVGANLFYLTILSTMFIA